MLPCICRMVCLIFATSNAVRLIGGRKYDAQNHGLRIVFEPYGVDWVEHDTYTIFVDKGEFEYLRMVFGKNVTGGDIIDDFVSARGVTKVETLFDK